MVYRKYCRTLPYELRDIVSYGVLGLIDAVDRFDPSRKAKFSTYAHIRVKGYIIDCLRKSSPYSRGTLDRSKKVNNLKEENKDITEEEIIEKLGLTHKKYMRFLEKNHVKRVSFEDDESVPEDDNKKKLTEILLKESIESEVTDRMLVEYILRGMPQKYRYVVSAYYLDGLTMNEIASTMEVTESRVSQLITYILKRTKKDLKYMGEDFL